MSEEGIFFMVYINYFINFLNNNAWIQVAIILLMASYYDYMLHTNEETWV